MFYSIITFICRFLVGRLMLTFNYVYNDKNNPHNALSSRQINLEGNNQTFFLYLHLVVMLFLEIVFPNMFYNDNSIMKCILYTLGIHILVNEPLYYIFHYLLHTSYLYSKMHSVHHSSVKTISTTTALQDKFEHLLYVVVFSPAMLLPYIYNRQQKGIVIMFYLIIFDIVNSFGHTRINLPDWYNNSFIKYLFYPPSFHINHHIHQKYNYCLFMPIFDKIFGTYYEDSKKINDISYKGQDFAFIGHNGGLWHFLNIPEINFYNMYNQCNICMNFMYECYIIHIINTVMRIFGFKSLKLPCYIANNRIGRVISLARTPLDYLNSRNYDKLNHELISLITNEYMHNNTKMFGLGNLNKMKELNDGGLKLIDSLPSPDILLWTGDSMTCASIYNYILNNKLNNIFYIGGTGKIGKTVCKMLSKHNIHIKIYSSNHERANEIVSYNKSFYTSTDNLDDIQQYTNIIIGKLTKSLNVTNKNIYDYTVPFIPLPNNNHIQIAKIKNTNRDLIIGYYDGCFGNKQHEIYACYCGCLVNFITGRNTHEVGEICEDDVIDIWEKASKLGFVNV